MSSSEKDSGDREIYAYLPFVALGHESVIELGPVVFWPASKSAEFLKEELTKPFEEYLDAVGKIKAQGEGVGLFNTETLLQKGTTCVSVSAAVAAEVRDFLLVDSLYLLYFACTFRSLYYGREIPPFSSFRKMIPLSEAFIKDRSNWQNLHIQEADREEKICLHLIDKQICFGLGKALESIYVGEGVRENEEQVKMYKRIIRSIRFLVDRFFQRFVNLFEKGLDLPQEIFEPEDVIFLSSSFESLFSLEESPSVAADFKHRLRPLLHLKYSKPVEVFWKWVDDFYDLKRRILLGDTFVDPFFRFNPNFEVSHILLGIKLFVYSIYYYLFTYQLLNSTHVDPYTPPDFKWIHPEEILLFFWTEPSVLEKIDLLMKQASQTHTKEECLSDLNLLTTLFVSLYDRYYLIEKNKADGMIRFVPTRVELLKVDGVKILERINQISETPGADRLEASIHPYFTATLEDRLQEKRLH